MKNTILLALVFFSLKCIAQENLPSVKLKSVLGKTIDIKELANETKDTPLVISFWASWCVPCISELDNINDELESMQSIKKFSFFGVAIDDARTTKKVKSFVKGKGWNFDVLLDENSELKRALNITDVPHVLIIKNNKIVYQHTGYIAGEEDNLFEEIKKL